MVDKRTEKSDGSRAWNFRLTGEKEREKDSLRKSKSKGQMSGKIQKIQSKEI